MARRCVECGRRHDGDRRCCPSCSPPPLRADGGVDGDGSDVEPFESIVWACPECGREHQKHSPPCSRCGNVTLEKQRKVHADLETPGGTSYLDVLELKYAVGYLAVVGFAVLVALSMAGIVSVPWLGGPSPPGAPGDAETYANVSLESVEEAYVAELNEMRAGQGVESLSVGSSLDGAATSINQRRVRTATGGEGTPDVGAIVDRYAPNCERDVLYNPQSVPADVAFDGQASAASVAHGLQLAPGQGRGALLEDRFSTIGVDVHVSPNDTVYFTVLVC